MAQAPEATTASVCEVAAAIDAALASESSSTADTSAAPVLPRRLRRLAGRRPILDAAGLHALQDLIESNQRMTLAELAAAFGTRTGKAISIPTLAKGMKALGYAKVRLKKARSEPALQTAPRYTAEHRREPTATTYPSTLTDREFAVLEPLLAKKTKRGRPPTYDKRMMLNAIFYQVRTGGSWRYLPKDFPHWNTVWTMFRRLRDAGVLERMYDALRAQWRVVSGGQREGKLARSPIASGAAAPGIRGPAPLHVTRARRSRVTSATSSSIQSDFLVQS